MSVSRRKMLGLISSVTAGLLPSVRGGESKRQAPTIVLGHQIHDQVSLSRLTTYARSLALTDRDARREATTLFHRSQIAAVYGPARAMRYGHNLELFLRSHETNDSSLLDELLLVSPGDMRTPIPMGFPFSVQDLQTPINKG